MKRFLWAAFAVILFLNCTNASAQSGNSNIGTEFWTAWMDHINGATGSAASQMNLYIASDVSTTGTVSLADGSFTITFNVVPKQITKVAIPSSAFLGDVNGTLNKGIHIVSQAPIAVYAHIYASSVSGATLLLPVNTLASDYYSLNYKQLSNSSPSYSLFMVIATEDNTTVQITPSAALIGGQPAKTTFTVTLNKGQVYQGVSNTDLTGTHITAINASGDGCKKIAVFSGSNKIYIGAPDMTSDNLFQQVYPTQSWGKSYITVPLKDRNYDVMRIVLSDPTAIVTLNGTVIPSTSFTNGFYYDFNTQTTNVITSNKPIQVVQYAVTQNNSINGTRKAEVAGDPEMIFLNPLEQTIDHVTLYSATEYKITQSYINVVIPTAAVSSFLYDGATLSGFVPVPGNTAYSYLQLNVGSNAAPHTLAASQGFNAIAYGFGQAESYGYAAGTNVINLSEYIQYVDPVSAQASTGGCAGLEVNPQVVLPFMTSTIKWDIALNKGIETKNYTAPSSSFVKNGQTLYVYDYGTKVLYSPGTYNVKASALNVSSINVCGVYEDVTLSYVVANAPTSKFTAPDKACVGDAVTFTDQSIGNGSAIKSWLWDFGDGTTSNLQNPTHTFTTAGDPVVRLSVIINTGCVDVVPKTIHITALAVPDFTSSTLNCETQGVSFTDKSTSAEGTITNWFWDFGDANATTANPNTSTQQNPAHIYSKAGTYTVKLYLTTDKGCTSLTTSKTVVVNPLPAASFTLPDVCLTNAVAQFTDVSTLAGTTTPVFTYLWDFGDANASATNPGTSTDKNPTHQYQTAGVYHVKLTITSASGCTTTATKDFTVSGKASFIAPTSACPDDLVTFTDKTDGATPASTSWHWDFGDNTSADVQNPTHAYTTPNSSPTTFYKVTLTVTGHNGCSTTTYFQNIHVNPKPVAVFTPPSDCEGATLSFKDMSTSAEGTITKWAWDFGDVNATTANPNTSALQNPTHLYTKAGSYTVKLYVTTDRGCNSITISNTVIINPTPVPSFSLPDVCLVNATAQFSDASTLPGATAPVFTYAWDFGDVNANATNLNASTLKNPVHQFTAAGTYHVKLTTTSANGCFASITKDFIVSGKASFTAVASTCPGDLVVFTDRTDGATPASTSWLWSFDDGTTSGLQNPTHAFNNSKLNYNVTLTVTGHNGCSVTSYSQPIHITIRPTANFTPPPLSCETKTVTFTDASTPGEGAVNTWVWDFGDNTATSPLQNPTHTYATAGTYIVKLTVTNDKGCISDSKSMTITVQPQPVADFQIPAACASDSYATFSAVQNPLIATYQWVFGNTAADVASGTPSQTGSTVSKPISAPNTYWARLIVTTTAGCVSEVSKPYYINGSPPQAGFDIQGGNTKICSDNTVTLINRAKIIGGFDNGTASGVDVYYDYAANPTVFVHYDRPAVDVALPPHTYPVEYSTSHTYTIRMVAYSGQSKDCVSEAVTHDVVMLPVPRLSFAALPNVCLDSKSFDLKASRVNNGAQATGKFYVDGSTTALTNDMFNPASAGVGNHTINYIATTSDGCSESAQQTITVEPIPTNVTAGNDKEVIVGESVTLDGKADGVNLTYKWSPSTGLDNSNSPTPKASPQVDTKYTLTVTSTTDAATPCAETATVNITVLHAPVPPNTFTPNGDNINDKWEIKYLDRFTGCTVKVFNRQGELLFTSIGYGIPWDGRYKGADLPVGTYYYIINPNHVNLKVISGSVNLIR